MAVITYRTRFIGATDTEGARVKVSRQTEDRFWSDVATIPYRPGADPLEAHLYAVGQVMGTDKLNSATDVVNTPQPRGYIFDVTINES